MSLRALRFTLLTQVVAAFFFSLPAAAEGDRQAEIDAIKQEIVALAESFSGQGDPDFSRQQALEPLVDRLVSLSPQKPVVERLPLLYGVWKQVWGPYDYRNDDRGVDPTIGTDEIYQVVFEGGYYYNVSPNFPDGDRSRERVSLLRGVFELSNRADNELDVRFTAYPGVDPRPDDVPLWELAALAENDQLDNRVTIVPTWLVRLFFRGGSLEEVYTDESLRILYGKNRGNFRDKYLYIMTRI